MSKNYQAEGFVGNKQTRAFVAIKPVGMTSGKDGAHIGVTHFMSPEEALELANEIRGAAFRAQPSLRHVENDE